MRAEYGVNVAPNGTDATQGGVGPWRRLVLSGPQFSTIGACQAYRARGWRVLGVATRQVTEEQWGGTREQTARRILDLFGMALDALQVWNEPDGEGQASDVASVEEYNAWLAAFRGAFDAVGWTKPRVAAGLVSGQPDFLRDVDMAGGYLLAVHPYDQKPSADYPDWGWGVLGDLLDAYAPYLPAGTGYWLTECSRTTEDEQLQARYADAFVAAVAARPDVAVCLWYCWREWMLGEQLQPFGLVRLDGSEKPSLGAWVEAVGAASGGEGMATVTDIDAAQATVYRLASPDVAYNPQAAIPKRWLELKQEGHPIGVPIGGEMQFPANEPAGRKAAQGFTGGYLLVWYGGDDVRAE